MCVMSVDRLCLSNPVPCAYAHTQSEYMYLFQVIGLSFAPRKMKYDMGLYHLRL